MPYILPQKNTKVHKGKSNAGLLHEAADIFLCRSTDGQAVDLNCRNADAEVDDPSVLELASHAVCHLLTSEAFRSAHLRRHVSQCGEDQKRER